MTQSARPAARSRSSLASSGWTGAAERCTGSGERKENLLQPARGQARGGAQVGQRALATDPSGGEQDESVADPPGSGELVDRKQERAASRRHPPEQGHDLPGLPQVEAVEGF